MLKKEEGDSAGSPYTACPFKKHFGQGKHRKPDAGLPAKRISGHSASVEPETVQIQVFGQKKPDFQPAFHAYGTIQYRIRIAGNRVVLPGFQQ